MLAAPPAAPAGLSYHPAFLSPEEERRLLERFETLAFEEVVMHGRPARRRTLHYGWLYGYESWKVRPWPPVPDFLEPLRARAAALAGVPAADFEEVLVSRYPPGAGIGWHRDAPMFGPIVAGVSLGAPCRLRLRPGTAGRAECELRLEPRSAYLLAGEARARWRHSIPAVAALRYSVTFRTLLRRP